MAMHLVHKSVYRTAKNKIEPYYPNASQHLELQPECAELVSLALGSSCLYQKLVEQGCQMYCLQEPVELCCLAREASSGGWGTEPDWEHMSVSGGK